MHIRDAGQIRQVKNSLMSLTVTSYQPRTVNGKYHRQILNTDIMEYLVICSLQERRIDSKDRAHASCCQSCCKSYRMFFRNSHIKKALRVDVFKTFQTRSIRHSRRNCHNLLISLSQFYHTGRKYILIVGLLPFIFRKSCFDIKWFCSVESGRMPLRRYKSFSFLSKHMDKHSAFDALCFLQNFL